jgi:cyclopropane fatty-acyl-phospholipid synthase-like methyltransferase
MKYYDKMAINIKDSTELRNKAKDFSPFDIAFMLTFADDRKTLLDLGSGTGLLVNGLGGKFKKIMAVEKYREFSRFIEKADGVEVVNEDIRSFTPAEGVQFDCISLFGVMNLFNSTEAMDVYRRVYPWLAGGGHLIVKNQMGVDGDVVVESYSEELGTDYYSEYRHLKREIEMLERVGFSDIDVLDVYPPEYNRWANTHFYALVCRK